MLLLVRHGQTSANAAGALLGRRDLALTALGERQAEAVARLVARVVGDGRPVRIVSSPLVRARATAEAVRGALASAGASLRAPGDLAIDERWIEVDYGVFEGEPLSELPAEVWERWRADASFTPEGGESLAAVGERVREACAELADEARDAHVVVVSHVSPIKAAVGWAIGAGDQVGWRLFLEPASLARVRIGSFGPVLVSFNEVAHLAGLDAEPGGSPAAGPGGGRPT